MQPRAVESPQPTFWQLVKDSLRGTHHDYTEGNLSRAIILLAVPMVLEMVMESLFGLVDIFFVAHLGEDAVASVGLTESMLVLVFSVAMGLAMATTAMVARRTGEKDRKAAAISAGQAILLAVAVSAVVGLFSFFMAERMLGWMGATPGIIRTGTTFTRIVMSGSAVIMLLFVNNAIFRGAGDAAIAMRTLWIANAINIVLDPCFILGLGPFPKLGVTGAAVATTIGRGVGVCYQFYMLSRGRVGLSLSDLRVERDTLGRLVRVASTGMVQYLIATASWMALARLVATFGATAIAGYTIAIRIIVFALLPSWGLTNAAATLVGQNLGAGKPDRAETSVWRTGLYNMAFLGVITVVFVGLAPWIVGIFTQDEGVLRAGVACLRTVSYGYVFYAWGMVTVQAFNGAGDTRTPTLINIACYWAFQIPLAYWLAIHRNYGAPGVFTAIPIAESALAMAGVWAFRRGTWKSEVI